mgnify:CR=1 FL=1
MKNKLELGGLNEIDQSEESLIWGTNNLTNDPLFIDGGIEGVNYHLTSSSACIDAGNPDLDGDGVNYTNDIDDQDPDGTRMDIGAYYFEQGIVVNLSTNEPYLTNSNAIPITIDFTQPPVAFNENYFQLVNCSITNFEGLDAFQTDVYIGAGSSGGPLFNNSQYVIGITTASLSGSSENINLAIPINYIQKAHKISTDRTKKNVGYDIARARAPASASNQSNNSSDDGLWSLIVLYIAYLLVLGLLPPA